MIMCKTVFEYSKVKIIILLSFVINMITMYLQKKNLLFMASCFMVILECTMLIYDCEKKRFKYKKSLTVEKSLTIKELEKIYINNKTKIEYLDGKNILLKGKVKSIDITQHFLYGTTINIIYLTDNIINIESNIKNASYKFKKYIKKISKDNNLILIGKLNIKNNNLILDGIYFK